MNDRAIYLRSIVFGINDSLVSTVGLLAGVSVAGVPKATIVLTGVVYALVEAFSMAMGNFLSEESAEEYALHATAPQRPSVVAAVLMFVSFAAASLVPLLPYFFFTDGRALAASVVLSVLALFLVGVASAIVARLPLLWRGVRMAALGGVAILIGVIIGLLMPAA